MVTVNGNTTALRRLTKAEVEDLRACKEVIWSILSKLDKNSLVTRIYVPPGADIADKLRREKLKAETNPKPKRAVVDHPKAETPTRGTGEPLKEVRRLAPTGPNNSEDVKDEKEVDQRNENEDTVKPLIPRLIDSQSSAPLHRQASIDNKDTDVKADNKAKFTHASVLSGAAASFVPGSDYALHPMDADSNDERTSTKSVAGSDSATGKESLASRPKSSRSQGVTDPGDFMKEFHKLRKLKELAAKAAAAGEVRRVVFGDLPEWGTIPNILQLVYGGAIERVWTEDGQVVVQFVEKAACEKYYENHSNGIDYETAEGERATISVTLPEDGLADDAELTARVAVGASRVVRLAGLPSGHKDSDDNSILGIVSQPGWGDKKFERVLIVQAESGVDVIITFYDLHDSWDFFQDIKEEVYDCIARFGVDPCARATAYHFMEEPNLVFNAVILE